MAAKALTKGAVRDVLAATALFAGLAGADLDALSGLAVPRRVKRGEMVMRRGDPGSSLMVLVSGRLRAGAVSVEGREVTHTIIEAGAVLGEIALLDGEPRSLDVTAAIESVLLVLERDAFLPFLMQRPALMLRLMAVLCERLRRRSEAFEDVAFSTAPARLAKLLLGLVERHGQAVPGGKRIHVKVSQRELSAQVAATREWVNRTLQEWREAGIMGEEDGYMVVLKADALRALLG